MKKSHHSNVRNSVRGGTFMLGMVTIIQGRLEVNRVAFVKPWSINSPHFLLYIPPTYFLISSYQLIAGVYSNLILFQPISSLLFPVLFYSILFSFASFQCVRFLSVQLRCGLFCSKNSLLSAVLSVSINDLSSPLFTYNTTWYDLFII